MMVFNPVYIQKSNEGDSQLFGSGFANQKTTYLFSDIIKVILAKTENSDLALKTEAGGESDQSAVAGNVDPLLITDAEVELFEKLMKINLPNADSDEIQKIISEDPSVLLESLQMYLTGLANLPETTPIIDKGFEIDHNDLAVLLNILAGNTVKNNNNVEGNIEIAKELNAFVVEINGILSSLEKKDEQCLLIQQDDISIELHPLQNGKILVKVSEQNKLSPIEKKINPELKLENAELTVSEDDMNLSSAKTDTPVNEKQISVPIDTQKVQTTSVKTESAWNETHKIKIEEKSKSVETSKVEIKPAEEKIVKQTAAISEALKNNTTISETVNSSSDKSVKTKKNSNPRIENSEKKIVFEIKSSGNESEKKIQLSDVSKVDKLPDSKEYFDGKIKVEVVTIKEDSTKASTIEKVEAPPLQNDSSKTISKSNVIEVVKEAKLSLENNSAKANSVGGSDSTKNVKAAELMLENKTINSSNKNTLYNSEVKISLQNVNSEKSKLNLQTNTTSVKEVFPEKTTKTQNINELPIEKDVALKPTKQTSSKEEKLDFQKPVSDLRNNTQVLTTLSSGVLDERQDQTINASVIDNKNKTEKDNISKSELSGVLSSKEKTAKAVISNNETDKQKPDGQQQNNFEKIFSNVNKTENIGKEIKESVKLVEQSRLMNEIENIIKSGERKAVTINLYPEELGSVKVSLDITDKSVTAKINVANDSIRQMILTQADSLKTSLSQSGIQLASLNVSVNNSEDKSTPQGKMKRKDGGVDKKIVISDIPNPVKVKNLGYNTYDYIA